MSNFAKVLTLVAGAFLSGSVVAQVATATVGSDAGAAGETIVIPVNFEAGSDIAGIEIDVEYPSASFSAVSLDCGVQTVGAAFDFCDDATPGTAAIKLARIDGETLTTGLLANISFTIDASAEGLQVLDAVFVAASNTAGEDLPPESIDLTDGQIDVLGPEYTSAPAPGPIDLGSVETGGANPSQIVTITNTGGEGTNLEIDCVENPDTTAFIIGNGSNPGIPQGGSHDVTVSCNAALAPDTYTGTMECSHNGTNIPSPAVYDLSCTVTPGPEPSYGSTPPPGSTIEMSAEFTGDPIADESVVIDNIGDSGTTLTGECSLTGDSEISLTGGVFSVPEAGPNSTQTLSCDSGAEGDFTAQLSCSHNGANIPTPATYTVNCSVGPLRPAVFGSSPAPGPIDITDGLDVVVGDTPPEAALQISNEAAAPAQDLGIECGLSGDAEISVLPDISGGVSVSAGASTSLTFACATDTAGTFSAIYACDYVTDDSGEAPIGGSAEWTVSCDVRDPKAVVEPQPAGGTTLTERVSPGGSAEYNVVFSETADEGIDGGVDCELEDGTNFSILTVLPDTVPAGESVTVTVEGTDPEDGSSSVTDALICTYTDSDNPEPGAEVRYPLVLRIGGEGATFRVTKDFVDDNPSGVIAQIVCDTGLPLQQDFEIFDAPGGHVDFVVVDFEAGTMDCVITELEVPADYSVMYVAGLGEDGDADVDSEPNPDGCFFENVSGGGFTCEIVNTADAATYTVVKDWVVDLPGGDMVIPEAHVTITCDSAIAGEEEDDGEWTKSGTLGDGGILEAEVDVSAGPATCSASEVITASGVESSSEGCGEVSLSAGGSHTCTFTNTVFFEGIPTLNQYGLALLALLMLGIGAVGLRRFV